MTAPKPPCSATGTYNGQSWQCTRDGNDKARHHGHVCPAHYMQWARAGYPDAFGFAPLRAYQAGAERAELRLYVPAALAEGLRSRSTAAGRSISSLCRPALERLLDDDS